MHRWYTLVEDLCPHQLDAGHDLLLMAHQRYPKPLDVPVRCGKKLNMKKFRLEKEYIWVFAKRTFKSLQRPRPLCEYIAKLHNHWN